MRPRYIFWSRALNQFHRFGVKANYQFFDAWRAFKSPISKRRSVFDYSGCLLTLYSSVDSHKSSAELTLSRWWSDVLNTDSPIATLLSFVYFDVAGNIAKNFSDLGRYSGELHRLIENGIQLKYSLFPVCRWRQMLQVMISGDALWWCRLIISQSYLERTIIAIRKSLPMNASNQFAIMERSRVYIAVSSSERFFIWSRLFAGWCHGSKVLTRGS